MMKNYFAKNGEKKSPRFKFRKEIMYRGWRATYMQAFHLNGRMYPAHDEFNGD